jgi:hypothetical protein
MFCQFLLKNWHFCQTTTGGKTGDPEKMTRTGPWHNYRGQGAENHLIFLKSILYGKRFKY